MLASEGLPTPEEKQNRLINQIQGVTAAQSNVELHKAYAANAMEKAAQAKANLAPVTPEIVAQHPEFAPFLGQPVPKPLMDFMTKMGVADASAQARENAAMHKTITVPGVGGFSWDAGSEGYKPIQGGQIPQHQLAPGEAEKFGFPSGTTQVPESTYAQAFKLQPLTRQGMQWKETSPGVWEPLPTTSTRAYGKGQGAAPSASPSGALPTSSTSTPSGGTSATPSGSTRVGGKVYGGGSIYAFDPRTNETVMTTPAEQQAKGYTNPRKVTQANIEADRQLNNRLYDVAAKIQRYEKSIDTPITELDRAKIADLLGTDKLQFGAFGAHLPTDWLTKLTQATSVAGLSPAAQQRLINYYNVREAMTGYTRVLTGSGRSNETNLQLNLQAMPDPIAPDNFTKEGINQFKQNVHIAGQGLPRMPGIQKAEDVFSPRGGTPNGATHTAKGSDGKMHYTNAKGEDLGVAQ